METATTLPGPLTGFSPPSACFDRIWYNFIGTKTDVVLGNPYNTRCHPNNWNTNVQYSPALCPSSYYAALERVLTVESETQTVIDCCPSSFRHDAGTYSCVSQINTSLASVEYTYSANQATSTTTVTVTGQGVNAHSIQVRYQSSDFALLFSTSTHTPAATTATNTSQATSTTSPVPVQQTASGLSTGAKAGIAVAAILVVVLLAALAWFFLRRHKRTTGKTSTDAHYEMVADNKPYRAPDETRPIQTSTQEKGKPHGAYELVTPVSELQSSDRPRAELPGS